MGKASGWGDASRSGAKVVEAWELVCETMEKDGVERGDERLMRRSKAGRQAGGEAVLEEQWLAEESNSWRMNGSWNRSRSRILDDGGGGR